MVKRKILVDAGNQEQKSLTNLQISYSFLKPSQMHAVYKKEHLLPRKE
jgi:hypothetical protein